MESFEAAQDVKQVFEQQFGLGTGNKPLKAIILTHFHPDHTFGFDVFKVSDIEQMMMGKHTKLAM